MYQTLLSHIATIFATLFFVIAAVGLFNNMKLKEKTSHWHIGMSVFIGLYTAVLSINTHITDEHLSIMLYFTHWIFSYVAVYCYLNAIEYYLKKKIPILKWPKVIFISIPIMYIISAVIFQFTSKSPFIKLIPEGLVTNYSQYSYITVMGSNTGMIVGYLGIACIIFSSAIIWHHLNQSGKKEYILKVGIVLWLLTGAYDTAIGLGNLKEQLPIFYLGFFLESIRFSYHTRQQGKLIIKGLSDEVAKLSKVAQFGIVTASISHDMRNHLCIISNALTILDKKPDNKHFLKLAQKYTDELTKLTDSYTNLFKNNLDKDSQYVEVRQIIESAKELSEKKLSSSSIKLSIPDYEDFKVEGNPTELTLCLTNLINNSLDAVAGSDSPWIKIIVSKKDFSIEVIDSGEGIPKENIEQLFEYDFSTKKHQGGTGLGLAIVKQILSKQGYQLKYNPNSRNTSFLLSFSSNV